MSVVNKMLQDLEARKSSPDAVNADYQPPQKSGARWLIWTLLAVAVLAITFALVDLKLAFSHKDSNDTELSAKDLPVNLGKKAMLPPETTPEEPDPQLVKLPITVEPNISDTTAAIPSLEQAPSLAEPAVIETPPLLTETIDTLQQESQQTAPQSEVSKQASVVAKPQPSFSMSGSTKVNQAISLKQRIAESLNNNDLDLAQSLLSELLLDEPENLKARKKLASLYFAQGNYAQTKQLLVRGIDLYPQQTDLRLMLARLYAVQDDTEQAFKVMKDIQPNATNQTEFLAYRAALAQQLKQPQISKADYLSLAGLDANNAKWWLGLAIAQDQLGEIKHAIKAYEKAYALGQLDDSVDEFIQQRISVLVGTQ